MKLRRLLLTISIKIFILIIICLANIGIAFGCELSGTDKIGYKIRSTKVDVRYLKITLPQKGTPYTVALDSELIRAVRNALINDNNLEDFAGATVNELSGKFSPTVELNYVKSCLKIIAEEICQAEVNQPKCLDITLLTKSLRINPNNPAENLLNAIPRSGSPSIISEVPKPLLLLNPKFEIGYDKSFGVSQNVEISTNLLNAEKLIKTNTAEVKPLRLDLKVNAKKSLSNTFYDSDASLTVAQFLPTKAIEKVSGSVKFSSSKLPNGDAELSQNILSIDGGILLKPNIPVVKNLFIEGGYSHKNNRFISNDAAANSFTTENVYRLRTLLDGQIKQGVLRIGLWTDKSKINNTNISYNRFAGLIGFAKEFGKSNQTFGLESLFGAGSISGDTPNYALYYGSNDLKNFIFESPDSTTLQRMPAGPLVRSFGNGQAFDNTGSGISDGSKNYWHFNLNLSIPIARWSKPLIPNEKIDIVQNPNCPIATIRDLITCQTKTGEVFLARIYRKQGLSDEDAAAKAKQEFKDVNSATSYLVNKSNIYSVKPLIMFDAANFTSPFGKNKTRFVLGGGLQLNIVIAKFEAGYLRTINPQNGDSRGNFLMRLYFQNLF